MFAAVHESGYGTTRPTGTSDPTCAFEGKSGPDMLRSLDSFRHRPAGEVETPRQALDALPLQLAPDRLPEIRVDGLHLRQIVHWQAHVRWWGSDEFALRLSELRARAGFSRHRESRPRIPCRGRNRVWRPHHTSVRNHLNVAKRSLSGHALATVSQCANGGICQRGWHGKDRE
jgi:hypothetical protein